MEQTMKMKEKISRESCCREESYIRSKPGLISHAEPGTCPYKFVDCDEATLQLILISI